MKKILLIILCVPLLFAVSACRSNENGDNGGSGGGAYGGETNLINIVQSLRTNGMTSWWEIVAVYNAMQNPLDFRGFDEIIDSLEGGGTTLSRAAYVIVTNISVVIGADPEYFEEYDNYKGILRQVLANPGSGNINDYIFAYLALKTAGEDFDETPVREHLERLQLPDGGFALSGDTGDPDMTAMAMNALMLMAYDSESETVEVPLSVTNAVAFLQNSMNEDGTFTSWGNPNANSTATVLSALSAHHGIAAVGQEGIIQQVQTGLALFEAGGGYAFLLGGERDPLATAQGAIALGDMQNGTNVWLKLYGDWHFFVADWYW